MTQKNEILGAKDRELAWVQQHLRSSEASVAELQKKLQQSDSELETLTATVGPPSPESLLLS